MMFIMGATTTFSQQGWLHQNFGPGNLISINFINNTEGFIFRSDKYLLKSTNSGENWTPTSLSLGNVRVDNGMFLNESAGAFIVFSNTHYWSGIYVTSNGGMTWNHSEPSVQGNIDLRKVKMINNSTGYAVGTDVDLDGDLPVDAIICKTTDAGQNWNINYPSGFYYNDIIFINDNTGFVCDFSILQTTNSGQFWFLHSQTSRERISFSEFFGDTIYLSSSDGYVAKSTNLGANWTENFTGINQHLTDIHFIDNQLGFAIGDSGGIVKTSNGGSNWIIQNSGTNKKLNELWFINKDTGFIAGDSGLLLVTYNGGVTSLSQNYQSTPEKFQLHQNFPNPFNPSTIIRFDLVRSGYIRLSVYDISGKRLSVLINESLSPGSYEYNFNADNLPSGVYFYKIETESFTETKRMVLIK